MGLEIVKPGLQTTVQDEGRVGVFRHGLPPSGALDKHAYRIGNRLVGNPDGLACLEMTYLGADLTFTGTTVFALTGADLDPTLNGDPIENWRSYRARAGDQLGFGRLRNGARAYLSVAGGIEVPLYESSRSTYTSLGLGGFGRPLSTGDEIAVGGSVPGTADRAVPDALRPRYPGRAELRVVLGLASYRFEPDSLDAFFEETWTVSPDANRVGYRYRGSPLRFVERAQPSGAGSDLSNVVDLGYPVGSIQVPGGLEPICVLNDAVTGGGYATLGTVISADLDRVGQSKTNEEAQFVRIDLEQALQARRDRQIALRRVFEAIGN